MIVGIVCIISRVVYCTNQEVGLLQTLQTSLIFLAIVRRCGPLVIRVVEELRLNRGLDGASLLAHLESSKFLILTNSLWITRSVTQLSRMEVVCPD